MSTNQYQTSSAGYTLAYLVCYLIGIGTGILMIIVRALLWRLRDRRKGGA